MPRFTFECGCGKVFDGLTTLANHDVCECGKTAKRMDTITAGAYHRSSADKEMSELDPLTVRALLDNKAAYERESADILSGATTLRENGPKWSRPECPDHMRKTYY